MRWYGKPRAERLESLARPHGDGATMRVSPERRSARPRIPALPHGDGATRLVSPKRPALASGLALLALLAWVALPSAAEHEAHDEAALVGVKTGAGFTHPEILAEMRADRAAPRHLGDGGGRAWLDGHADGSRQTVTAGSRDRFAIIFEVGPAGIAVGGLITLQVSPFWGWDTPQTTAPAMPGFTGITTNAKGVKLRAETLGPQLLALHVSGRALEPGEQVRIEYGAGEARARVDRFAEEGSRFWIGVDADGDGVRKLIADPPAVDVLAGPPALVVASLPGTARVGDEVLLHLAVLDRAGNMGASFAGSMALRLDGDPQTPGLEFPATVKLEADAHGIATVAVRVLHEGIHRLAVRSTAGVMHPDADAAAIAHEDVLEAETNPLVVDSELKTNLLWADLQVHSQISDGSATPDQIFTYGRDVAGLDVVAITDHDHWGLEFLDTTPRLWEETRASVTRHHRDGSFVAIPGFEWTNWVQGHRHVLFFDPAQARIITSLDEASDTPDELWSALQGTDAITIAHHSAGGPVPIDWSWMPPPGIEPVTEIASVHGSSESADSPNPIYNAKAGNFVRDGLALGHRFGFVGSSDGHDGHPGLSQLAGGHSGVAGLWVMTDAPADARSRRAIRDTLLARRTYATNGPRIFVEVALDGLPMGAELPPLPKSEAGMARPELEWRIAGTAPIKSIEVIRGNGRIGRIEGDGSRESTAAVGIAPLAPGEWLYLRILQSDGGAAWTSPFFAPKTAASGQPDAAGQADPIKQPRAAEQPGPAKQPRAAEQSGPAKQPRAAEQPGAAK